MNFLRKAFLFSALSAVLTTALCARVVRIPSYYSYDYLSSDTPGVTALYYETLMSEIASEADWEYDLVDISGKSSLEALREDRIDLAYDVVRTEFESGAGFAWGENPSGVQYILLVTREDNIKYNATYLANLNGARIGYEAENKFIKNILDAFIQANRLIAVPVPLDSRVNAAAQMASGKIDLYVSSRAMLTPGEKIIYNFGHFPVHFVAGDHKIIEELDFAQAAMRRKNPLYMENVLVRSNGLPSVGVENITALERQFITQNKKIALIDDDFNYDGSEGAIRESFWSRITGMTGLEFDIQKGDGKSSLYPVPSIYDAVITDRVRNSGIFYTIPYYHLDVRVVCAPGISLHSIMRLEHSDEFIPKKERISLIISQDLIKTLPYFSDRFIPYDVTVAKSTSECLSALSRQKYDVALVSDFSLQQRFSINDYKKLRDQEIIVFQIPMSIVYNGEDSELVTSIINKALSQLPYNYYNSLQSNQGLYINRVPSHEVVRYRVLNFVFLLFAIFVFYNLALTLWRSRKFQKQIRTDQLTGLLSMSGFEAESTKMIKLLPSDEFMLTELNVRDFSFINRLYGPGSGDRILGCIARTLTDLFSDRPNCFMARGYADNFYIMQHVDTTVEDTLKNMAESQNILQEQLQQEEGYRLVVKCGNVIDCGTPGHQLSVKDMIRKAGYVRRAKQESLAENFSVFNNEIRRQREAEERIESTIEKALEDKEFFIMLQPKMDLSTKKCVGAEALVRWQTKDNGVLSPDQFIPILEKNGYVTKVDFFVYKTVFGYIKKCLDEKISMVPVSLNISRLNHDSATFVSEVNNLFRAYEIPSNLVEFEIEERFAGANDEILKEMTSELHESGYLVNLDDFGADEKSLDMLSDVPVDVVKFDQRFLHYAGVSESSRAILVNMIKAVKESGKRTICEGVETSAQVEILRSAGCDTVQGYYYSRPLSPERFREFLLKHS